MENLKKIEQFISTLGWFAGEVSLLISVNRSFEGYYGKASEDWETQIVIEIKSPKEDKCPNIKIVGNRYEKIEDVARRVLFLIDNWKEQNKKN